MAQLIPTSMAKKNHSFAVDVIVPKTCSTRDDVEPCPKKATRTKLLDLPCDLLANILERLSSSDRIRFGATRKTNLFLVTTKHDDHGHRYEFRAVDKLPWLATLAHFRSEKPGLSFRLFNPCHRRGLPHYATYQIHDLEGRCFGLWVNRVKAAKRGWFLCSWPKQEGKKVSGLTTFLLFSPFNTRIIKLPDLDRHFVNENYLMDHLTCRATFSSNPSSPDCVYFFLSKERVRGRFSISTLHQRYGVWKTMVFDKLIENVSSVVYHEGCFYCASSFGELATYDVLRQRWEVIIDYSSLWNLNPWICPANFYILVCEGKVLAAFVKIPHGEFDIDMVHCGLLEFKRSKREWVERTSLVNHALFLGCTSFAVPASSWSSCNDDKIAEKMYFYNPVATDQQCLMYYSFKDGRCHMCKDSGSWSSNIEKGIWIEPLLPF